MTQAKIRQRLQGLVRSIRVFTLERRQLLRHGGGRFYWRSARRTASPRNTKAPNEGGSWLGKPIGDLALPILPNPPLRRKRKTPLPGHGGALPAPLSETALPERHGELRAMATATALLTPPETYPALSLDRLMSWLREIRANPNLRTSRKAVAFALATYHNSDTGWTFPGITRLARDTGLHRETVIAAYRDLEAEGHLEHVERYADAGRRRRLTHQYVLKLRGAAPATPANDRGGHGTEAVGSADAPPSDQPITPPSDGPTETTKPFNDQTERTDAAPAAPAPVSDQRLDRLARRAQRLANGKGWKLKKARDTVECAVQRAGIEAVERTLGRLEEGNQRPAWELVGVFNGLRRADIVVSPTGRVAGPQDAAWRAAERIYLGMAGGGVVDFSARMRVQKAVLAAGVSDLRWQDRLNTVSGIAAAIRAGTLDPRG
jgi:DNA-binding MarR family transcriptional regulator